MRGTAAGTQAAALDVTLSTLLEGCAVLEVGQHVEQAG
jgi:hypothetical protein